MHLVRVHDRTPSRRPSLGELRDRVVADLREEHRRERGHATYRALRDDYEVRLPAANGQGASTDHERPGTRPGRATSAASVLKEP